MTLCCCQADDDSVADKRAEISIMESKGLQRCPPPVPILQRSVGVPVQINVYSLLEQNKKLKKLGVGVYHCGVVVYGIEWGYGESVESATVSGMFCVHPGQAAGTLYRTKCLGITTLSPQQVDTILHRLENEWRSGDYHILNHNCNHFAQRFCDLLSTVQKLQIPKWCNRAARVGNRIVPKRLAAYIHRLIDEEPPKAPVMDRSRISEMPVSVIPQNWYLHPSISQKPRFTIMETPVVDQISSPDLPLLPPQEARKDNILSNTPRPATGVDCSDVDSDAMMKTSPSSPPPIAGSDASSRGDVAPKNHEFLNTFCSLQHDLSEVVFFSSGNGGSYINHGIATLATTVTHINDDNHTETKSLMRLESATSQQGSPHMAEINSGEEWKGITLNVCDEKNITDVTGDINHETSHAEEESRVLESARSFEEPRDMRTIPSSSLSAPESTHYDGDTKEKDNDCSEEDEEKDEEDKLLGNEDNVIVSPERREIWMCTGEKEEEILLGKAEKMLNNNILENTTMHGETSLGIREDTCMKRLSTTTTTTTTGSSSAPSQHALRRGSNPSWNKLNCIVPLHVMHVESPSKPVTPPLGALEASIASFGDLYSDPLGDDEDANGLDNPALPPLRRAKSTDISNERKHDGNMSNPLLYLYSTPILRKNNSWHC